MRAGFVLRLIGGLYHYEEQWHTAGPRLRAALRQWHFGLALALLKETAQQLQGLCLSRSQLGQACAYLLGQQMLGQLLVHYYHTEGP